MGIFVLLVAAAGAEEFPLANGKTVKGDLNRVDPDGLVISTDAGVEKVSFLMLSEEVRKRYGFDLKKADEFRAQQAAAQKQMLDQQAAAIRERAARVESMMKDQPTLEDQQLRVKIEAQGFKAKALVLQGTSTGVRVRILKQTGKAAATMLDQDTRASADIGEGFIHDLRAADGETWEGKLYPAGLHTYKTSFGAEKTLRGYALKPETAVEKSKAK